LFWVYSIHLAQATVGAIGQDTYLGELLQLFGFGDIFPPGLSGELFTMLAEFAPDMHPRIETSWDGYL